MENVGIMMLNKIAIMANVINNSIRLKPAAVWKERFAVRKDALAGVFIRFGL